MCLLSKESRATMAKVVSDSEGKDVPCIHLKQCGECSILPVTSKVSVDAWEEAFKHRGFDERLA